VKETLDAKSQYGSGDDNDGASVHRINQYIIKQEIGRGSFGAVHLAQDQFGHEFVRYSHTTSAPGDEGDSLANLLALC
jgi:serine/threonine protein kinase